ncbi:DUF3108 domain-containing protein [Paludibacterium paludis]|uniref:DUF3108 domain-containing protein n=1 Tax=Paludibacterium paludis TaxID=1225769 RepID=A0A918UBZ2_9NEIS|nr:DUF3108 domain-containing protein [Paludibacterium paludis]GGY27202.1 hypothetical protein GCM10011289_33280 [Paludibacterium paludis]
MRLLSSRRRIAAALLLSLLIHLAVGIGDAWLHLTPAPMPDTPLRPMTARLASLSLDETDRRSDTTANAPGMASLPPGGKDKTAREPEKKQRAKEKKRPASAPMNTAHAPGHDSAAPAAIARAETSAPSSDASAPEAVELDALPARFPDSARLTYDAYNGAFMAGVAQVDWQRTGRHYRLESRITIAFVGIVIRYLSEGDITRQGLKPRSFTAWRNDVPKEKADFDWTGGQLTYGEGEPQRAPLRPGAQDVFSVMYQLALKGAGPDGQSIQVTTGKKVRDRPVAPSGEADLETRDGPIRAIVIRSQDADSLTEFWLAPDYANQPVRVRRVDKNLNLDLRISRIELNGETVWKQSPPIQRKISK